MTRIKQFVRLLDIVIILRARLKSTTVVWAAWQVGGTVSQHNIFDTGNFERLVLLNPDGKIVEAIAKSMKKDLEQLTTP